MTQRAVLQRQLTIAGSPVTRTDITRRSAYKTRLNAIISSEAASAGFAPQAVRAKLVERTGGGAHTYASKRDAVVAAIDALADDALADAAWDQLQARGDVVYANPPLTESRARAIVTNIEQNSPNALVGLQRAGSAYHAPPTHEAREHEWGILKAKTRADECVLIIGDPTGVTWSPFLDCGIGIAHAHPYFETGKTRHPRHHAVLLDTKQIADHQYDPPVYPGFIAWDDLVNRRSQDAEKEVSKIFPSASDIRFSADKHVHDHTVYTPYAVVARKGVRFIANPYRDFDKAPRLVFSIIDAQPTVDGENYQCTLIAREGGQMIWSAHVTTQGTGQFGLLNWSRSTA